MFGRLFFSHLHSIFHDSNRHMYSILYFVRHILFLHFFPINFLYCFFSFLIIFFVFTSFFHYVFTSIKKTTRFAPFLGFKVFFFVFRFPVFQLHVLTLSTFTIQVRRLP